MTPTAMPPLAPALSELPIEPAEQEYPPRNTPSDRRSFSVLQDMELAPRMVVWPLTWSSDGNETLSSVSPA